MVPTLRLPIPTSGLKGERNMSLYSMEEICKFCIFAVWHTCEECYYQEPKFCHCKGNNEQYTNGIDRSCPYREIVKEK